MTLWSLYISPYSKSHTVYTGLCMGYRVSLILRCPSHDPMTLAFTSKQWSSFSDWNGAHSHLDSFVALIEIFPNMALEIQTLSHGIEGKQEIKSWSLCKCCKLLGREQFLLPGHCVKLAGVSRSQVELFAAQK